MRGVESARARGAAGEAQAADYLAAQGMEILARNFSIRGGEIDLIAQDGAYIVFIEVKMRTGAYGGLGREAVTTAKQRRICRAAMQYLIQNALTNRFVRFDVVEIQNGTLTHIKNAFPYIE